MLETSPYDAPDLSGHFGPYGGTFIPEILVPVVESLSEAYAEARRDAGFQSAYTTLLREYVGRPTLRPPERSHRRSRDLPQT